MRVLLILIAAVIAVCGAAGAAEIRNGTAMPAVFEQGLVFLELPAPDNSTLRLFTDSGGGGLPSLSTEAAERLQLTVSETNDEVLLREFGPNVRLAVASAYMSAHWPGLSPTQQFIVVPGVVAFEGWPQTADGTLGPTWFAHRNWTWDYPHGQLILRPKNWRPAGDAHELAVSFRQDGAGHRSKFNYPRVTVQIDGRAIPMLLDTGATTVLTPAALATLDDGQSARRSTSMVIHSQFEAWHSRHGDWRIIEDAQLGSHSRMILVPNVRLAGLNVGPVWFTERDDDRFQGIMSWLAGGRVDGSMGGNAFAALQLSVDYPKSRAWVQAPRRH